MIKLLMITDLINWEFALRLLLAGVFGIIIGLEREYRAKEAGFRTHFLVCVGSALMMLISKYAFWDLMNGEFLGVHNAQVDSENISISLRVDPGRIAAGVVSGIGFLGAGTIIINRQIIKGLTTAAGIWAIAGIGLAVGAGMYWASIITTILVLIALEVLSIFSKGINLVSFNLEFEIKNKGSLDDIEKILSDKNVIVLSYMLNEKDDIVNITTSIKIRKRSLENNIFAKLSNIDGLTIHKVEKI